MTARDEGYPAVPGRELRALQGAYHGRGAGPATPPTLTESPLVQDRFCEEM